MTPRDWSAEMPHRESMEAVIAALLDEQTPLPHWLSHRLSDLTPEEAQELAQAWPKIHLNRRRSLLETLELLTESDYTLSFWEVGHIALGDPDAQVRALGIRVLWDEEQPALAERLLTLLEQDPDDTVRATAAGALGNFVYLGEVEELAPALAQRIVNVLLAICQDEGQSAEVRRSALEAVSFATHDAIPALIEAAYAQPEEAWKRTALFAMGRSGDRRWGKTVLQHLHDPNPSLRAEAATAAGRLNLKQAVDPLLQLLEDTESAVRMAAAWALSEIGKGGRRVEKALRRALKNAADEEEANLLHDALDNFAFNAGLEDMLPLLELDEEDLQAFLQEEGADDLEDYLVAKLLSGDEDLEEELLAAFGEEEEDDEEDLI